MAKKGMKRYYPKHKKNEVYPAPEIQGKARHSKEKVNPLAEGLDTPIIKTYHAVPFTNQNEIPPAYGFTDNDLAVENIENDFDLTAADKQDLS